MSSRLINCFEQENLFTPAQFGFRRNKSTQDALATCLSHLTLNHRNGLRTAAVFLDLSRAFETVDHSILLNKLHRYGVRGVPHKWFLSYLDGRSQCVSVNGAVCESLPVSVGVPQGSILGPSLFLVHINDLPEAVTYGEVILFADDTTILVSAKEEDELFYKVERVLSEISHWLSSNNLRINIDKSSLLIFLTK